MVPETCWASNKICNKYHLLHLVGILFPQIYSKSTQICPTSIDHSTSTDNCTYNTAVSKTWGMQKLSANSILNSDVRIEDRIKAVILSHRKWFRKNLDTKEAERKPLASAAPCQDIGFKGPQDSVHTHISCMQSSCHFSLNDLTLAVQCRALGTNCETSFSILFALCARILHQILLRRRNQGRWDGRSICMARTAEMGNREGCCWIEGGHAKERHIRRISRIWKGNIKTGLRATG